MSVRLTALLVVILLICGCSSSFAITMLDGSSSSGETLSFTKKYFEGGQKLHVYTGPGYEYYRANSGKAAVDTDDTIWMAGREGDWALIMYRKSSGGFRIGYIDATQLQYKLGGNQMKFAYKAATVSSSCELTDDTKNWSDSICRLDPGDRVTFLASYYDHMDWAYVEVLASQPIRGFIPMDCIK